tara:strand:+ start:474 stop:1478 length:1005 start_codon:yes stop_codon:yes gene_type:complete
VNGRNVVMSNSIAKGRYKFTKEEQGFVYSVISQISAKDEEFKTYRVYFNDLRELQTVTKNYQRFTKFAEKLLSKTIKLRNEKEKSTIVCNWFSSITHTDGDSFIDVRFDPVLKPYFIKLGNQFVQAKLPILLSFKSKYSSRLYLYLKSIYDLDTSKIPFKKVFKVVSVNELILDFEMPKSYVQRYSLFKNDFLNKSIEEINGITHLNISYDDKSTHRKSGRKITSTEFCITEKIKSYEEIKKEIETTETLSDYLPENLNSKSISVLLDKELGLNKYDLKKIFDHYKVTDIEDICEELWKCWDSPKIISKQGLLRGKIKQLDKKKTENLRFFDEV